MGLFQFFCEAITYIRPEEEALRLAGEDASRHSGYHRRIIWVSGVLGVIGAVGGPIIAALAPGDIPIDKRYSLPFWGAAVGIFVGVTLCCLFAPREFLLGPVGQKWMRLIGTKSTAAARAVCLVVLLFVAGFLTAVSALVFIAAFRTR